MLPTPIFNKKYGIDPLKYYLDADTIDKYTRPSDRWNTLHNHLINNKDTKSFNEDIK